MADNIVAKDTVVKLAYTLTVDGEIIDMADEQDAIEFLQGHRNIISGLESQLDGMKVGESKTVSVSAEEGYGAVDEDAFDEVPLSEFPEDVTPEMDMELELKDAEGNDLYGRIVAIGDESVTMDFNHPLAGKELHFEIKVVDVRPATAEEIAHGHVHSHGDHHHH
ncbi:MAG: peptidylprolyl isomerase [Anaerolineales bacterium]|nr:peptidylprolyl isomerase [Anaerolineales bacterium]MCW5855500.1 peptidylprolyl isomerase [Anaerolineales bacterium]